MLKTKKGFTLVELLVVISVIGVLAGLILVSFGGSQKQARDTARKSDLKQYQTAMENFANINNGLYVSRTGQKVQASKTICNDISLEACPEDPRYEQDSSQVYYYRANGSSRGSIDATLYFLWAKLESVDAYWVVCSDGRSGEVPTNEFSLPWPPKCPLDN